MELRRVVLDNTINANANIATIDGATHKIVCLSILGYDAAIKKIVKEMNRKNASVYIERHGTYQTGHKEYEVKRYKDNATDYGHAILTIKDDVEIHDSGVVALKAYLYTDLSEQDTAWQRAEEVPLTFRDLIIEKLLKHMPIAIIDEWRSYVATKVLQNRHIVRVKTFKDDSINFSVFKLSINSNELANYIQTGLSSHTISINGTNVVSEEMQAVEGMDSYLNAFSVPTARKLEQLFAPKFIPGESSYNERLETLIDYVSYRGIDLYGPQKVVIQAAANNLDKNDVSLIVAQPGSGKTLLGPSTVLAHTNKENTTNIVICPGHLVEKWASEIKKYLPLCEAFIVDNFTEFLALEDRIKDKRRRKHMFIIMSTSTAKTSYEKRPAAVWSKSKKAFCCPSCGKKLRKKEFAGRGKDRYEYYRDLTELDFVKEYAYNRSCDNSIKHWDKSKRIWTNKPCNENLWMPFMREGAEQGKWIRLSRGQGWVQKQHLDTLFDRMIERTDLDRSEVKLLNSIQEAIQSEEDGTTIVRAPRKYSLANYIRKFYKGKIDYIIADELHKYKGGDSLQGQAFGDLVNASRKVIGLTGTLLNGYADSLFYILYRTYPHVMKAEGFDYKDEKEFARTFGVVRNTSTFNTNGAGNTTTRIGQAKEKFLPGVSPIVFTKFLLENAVFLNLNDISDSLPSYEEIPVSVPMDADLQLAYEEIEKEFRGKFSWGGKGVKMMGSMLQALSAFPDMPYNQPDVIHSETGEVVITLPNLPVMLRSKEAETIRLCKERIEAGDKVLLYYHWTNRTNVAERMTELLEAEGLRVTVLNSNSSTTREREAWIRERTPETDVLICNPALVETGLDLLDYTSIIFFQVGYDIFTMRQASKRSYRLNQTRDVKVYFVYYQDTIQEQALSLMAAKLQASQAIEGNFSEEGLHAMSQNEDLLTQIANSVVKNIKHTVDINVFAGSNEEVEEVVEQDVLGSMFDDIESREVVAVFNDKPRIRIEFNTYRLSDSAAAKKKRRKKAVSVSPVETSTKEVFEKLKNKQIQFASFM